MEVVAESPTDLLASANASPEPQPQVERKAERMDSLISWAANTDNDKLEELNSAADKTVNDTISNSSPGQSPELSMVSPSPDQLETLNTSGDKFEFSTNSTELNNVLGKAPRGFKLLQNENRQLRKQLHNINAQLNDMVAKMSYQPKQVRQVPAQQSQASDTRVDMAKKRLQVFQAEYQKVKVQFDNATNDAYRENLEASITTLKTTIEDLTAMNYLATLDQVDKGEDLASRNPDGSTDNINKQTEEMSAETKFLENKIVGLEMQKLKNDKARKHFSEKEQSCMQRMESLRGKIRAPQPVHDQELENEKMEVMMQHRQNRVKIESRISKIRKQYQLALKNLRTMVATEHGLQSNLERQMHVLLSRQTELTRVRSIKQRKSHGKSASLSLTPNESLPPIENDSSRVNSYDLWKEIIYGILNTVSTEGPSWLNSVSDE